MKRIAFGFIVMVSLAAPARAEIAFGESIEWITADADRVITGKVVKVEMAGKNEVATVEVRKTLRGKHEPKATFALRSFYGAPAKGWFDAGVPALFSLRARQQSKDDEELPKGYAWELRDDGNHPSVVALAKGPRSINVFTRDFGMLTEPATILKHVEAYGKSMPADWKKRYVVLDAPGDSAAYKKLWSRSSVFLTLPVDAQLETQGRRWCKSADPDRRVLGVQALARFKNGDNIKLLKSLLQDSGFSTGDGMRRYNVRRVASEALQGFGVDVARPVLEELDKKN
jgi:hypothetical protein